MYSVYGRPRSLSAAQVAAAQEWHLTRKTARQMADELGISVQTLLASVTRADLPSDAPGVGRTRKLTGDALECARRWYAARRSRAERARELGMTRRQLDKAIYRRRTGYKQAPPEHRAEAVRIVR
jgi:hypothetical protein